MSRRSRNYVYKVEAFSASGKREAYVHRATSHEATEDAHGYLTFPVSEYHPERTVVRCVISKRIGDSKEYAPVAEVAR